MNTANEKRTHNKNKQKFIEEWGKKRKQKQKFYIWQMAHWKCNVRWLEFSSFVALCITVRMIDLKKINYLKYKKNVSFPLWSCRISDDYAKTNYCGNAKKNYYSNQNTDEKKKKPLD